MIETKTVLALASAFFEVVGTLSIAYAALRVHHNFLHEHKVDEKVFRTMRKEQRIGWLGVGFIVIGFILQLVIHLA